jgi:DNA-binding transcriptional MerR regulator
MTFVTLLDMSEEMRLDELAHQAGVASTTVRLYQAKGLLPGPRLVGRTGWYDRGHLARLHLIARLQSEGFSLAGIGRLLDSWEQGRDLATVVGVEEQLAAVLHRGEEVVLTPAELAAQFPAGTLSPEVVAKATALGLVRARDDGRLVVPDRRFLETGTALVRLGIPADVVLDEWEHLVGATDVIAERFVSLFLAHLAPPDWQDGLDDAAARRLATTLAELRRQAEQVVLTAFDASLARLAATHLDPVIATLADGRRT